VKDIGANATARDLRVLFEAGSLGGLDDGQLLDRFVARREEAVFEAIVHRHGPMVLGVCRRVLRDHHDAEDAFQATFLVLARRAASISRRELVANWLYAVANRTARKARAMGFKRRAREQQVAELPEPVPRPPRDDIRDLLDAEVSRLPEKYRIPIVLCELEGRTHREAAERLGWPIGTVSGRLSRARAMLARRLPRPGVMSLTVLLARDAASATVPTPLIGSTARAAVRFAAGRAATAGVVPAEVLSLAEGASRMMIYAQFRTVAWVVLLVVGGVVVAGQGPGAPTSATVEAGPERGPSVAPAGQGEPGGVRGDRAEIDEDLAKAAGGRIVRASGVSKDCMVLSYLPDWGFGDVDNLGIENHDGGVRSLVDWPQIPAEEAGPPGRRFLLAFYARKATSRAKAGPILAFEVEGEWPERTSWKTMPGYATEPSATFRFEPGEGWKVFDVTPIVRGRWKEGRAGRGIILRFLGEDSKGGGGWSGYQMVSREAVAEWASRRPQLLMVDPPQVEK